ncbi:MAG: hypothetical protein OJF59_002189 [Cytophagales bacterium]|nr:MAG: hypothetical protein OJF59_002189 [Cytophagales bacterium]
MWVVSLAALLATFFYVYASLPQDVVVSERNEVIKFSREALFYMTLAVIALANASVFAVTRIFPRGAHEFKTWFYGLIMLANVFFIVSLDFISLYNSAEKFDYSSIGFIIYGSIALLAGWAVGWPVYQLSKRFLGKMEVPQN